MGQGLLCKGAGPTPEGPEREWCVLRFRTDGECEVECDGLRRDLLFLTLRTVLASSLVSAQETTTERPAAREVLTKFEVLSLAIGENVGRIIRDKEIGRAHV